MTLHDRLLRDCINLKSYAKSKILSGASMLKFVEDFESKILKLGYNIAFPTNIAQGNIIAHWTPPRNCTKKFLPGLCTIDFGIEYLNIIIDTAFTMPIGDTANMHYSKLIKEYRADLVRIAHNTTSHPEPYTRTHKRIETTTTSGVFAVTF